MTEETPEYQPGGLVPEPLRMALPLPGERIVTQSAAPEWLEDQRRCLDQIASAVVDTTED